MTDPEGTGEPRETTTSSSAWTFYRSNAEMVEVYMDTAARLVAAHADSFPLDITTSIATGRRVKLGVTPRGDGETEPHLARTSESLKRIGGPLGQVVLDSTVATTLTLRDGKVEGRQDVWKQRYDTEGNVLPGKLDTEEYPLKPVELWGALTEVAERTEELTVDVPLATIDEIRQAIAEATYQTPA